MLRILGYATSINVRKVLWACEELGLAYQREDWGGVARPTSDPAFVALSPFGMVPVIDDDGTIVRESNTILRYLAARHGRVDLLPAEPASRAQVEEWMDWQASDFNNSWRVAFQGLVRRNPDHQDRTAIDASVAAFSRMVAMVDARIAATGGHVAGAAFTLADIPVGLSIHRWFSLPANKPRYEHIDRYYTRLCERAGFRTHGRDAGP
jgi:glutathione S-transferase